MSIPVPKLRGVQVRGVKETSQQVDMRLDMLSVQDMDTGQYQAMVIQDPDDRRKVSGYIHLAQVFTCSRRVLLDVGYGQEEQTQATTYQSLDYLIKAHQEYTGIEADYPGPIPLDDPRLREVPWLLLPSWFGESHAGGMARLPAHHHQPAQEEQMALLGPTPLPPNQKTGRRIAARCGGPAGPPQRLHSPPSYPFDTLLSASTLTLPKCPGKPQGGITSGCRVEDRI